MDLNLRSWKWSGIVLRELRSLAREKPKLHFIKIPIFFPYMRKVVQNRSKWHFTISINCQKIILISKFPICEIASIFIHICGERSKIARKCSYFSPLYAWKFTEMCRKWSPSFSIICGLSTEIDRKWSPSFSIICANLNKTARKWIPDLS